MWTYRATVIRVVDGDTVDVRIDAGFRLYHETRLRLTGIDAPEMNSRDTAERDRAKAATTYLSAILWPGAEITVTTDRDRREKFGRYLGRITTADGLDVNEDMIRAGMARVYG